MSILENSMLFVQVVQAGSMTKAAAILFSSKSNISRRIAQLEQQLDVTLLHKTPKGIQLTAQGKDFYQDCLSLQQDFESAKERLHTQNQAASGHIAITAPMSLGSLFIGPLLGKFMRIHKEITLSLDLSDNAKSMEDNQFDLAIRAASMLPNSDVYAKKLHTYRYVIVGSPEYLNKHGHPSTPEAISNHHAITCITTHDKRQKTHWPFTQNAKTTQIELNVVAEVTHMWLQKQLALDGIGLIRVPEYWVKDELDNGYLLSVLADCVQEKSHLFAIYNRVGKNSLRVMMLVEYLQKHLPNLLL